MHRSRNRTRLMNFIDRVPIRIFIVLYGEKWEIVINIAHYLFMSFVDETFLRIHVKISMGTVHVVRIFRQVRE